MRYGRFTDMPREDVIAYLEDNSIAAFDTETTDELRSAAHTNEGPDEDTDPGPFFRLYQIGHMNETEPGTIDAPVTALGLWTIVRTTGDKMNAEREVLKRNRASMASNGADRRIWRVREIII